MNEDDAVAAEAPEDEGDACEEQLRDDLVAQHLMDEGAQDANRTPIEVDVARTFIGREGAYSHKEVICSK